MTEKIEWIDVLEKAHEEGCVIVPFDMIEKLPMEGKWIEKEGFK